MNSRRWHWIWLCICISVTPVGAQQSLQKSVAAQEFSLNIPPQPLEDALNSFSRQTHLKLAFYAELGRGLISPRIAGNYTPEVALRLLLANTGLRFKYIDPDSVAILPNEPGANSPAETSTDSTRLARGSVPGEVGPSLLGSGNSERGTDHSGAKSDPNQTDKEGEREPEHNKHQIGSLEDIVVTAQKRTERAFDVPISITALNEAYLKEAHITNIAALSLEIPGLAVVDSGPNYRMVFIRGIANGDLFGDTPLVGTYLDEAAVSGFGGGAMDLRTYDLARVEVLRGPQGTLYGEGSMGGTIRFITNDPRLDRFSGSSDVTLSFTEHGDPSQDIVAVLNVPLVNEKLALRVAGEFEHAGGWIDEPAANAKGINFQNVTDVRTKILWEPNDALKVSGLANIHRNRAGAPNYGEDASGNYTQTLGETTVPRIDDNFDVYSLTLTHDLGSFAVVNSASYERSLKQLHHVGNIIPLTGPPPTPPDELLFNWKYASQQRSDELRATSTGPGPWNWTVGVYVRDGQFDIVGPYLLRFVSTNTVLPINYVKEMSTKSWSFFGQSGYKFFDRLEVGLGLRYFTDDQRLSDGQILQEATFHSLDPRVYANFDIGKDARLYVSAAKGFRSGGFNVSPDQPPFGPESVWTYELGTKAQLPNGRIDAELAVFYSVYTDMQAVGIPPPPALPVDYTFNAGTAHIKGVDVSFAVHATDAVSAGVKGTYSDAKYVKVNVLAADHAVGDPLDYVPQYSCSAWGKYDFRWGQVPGFVRLDYMKQGKSHYRNRTIYAPPLQYASLSDTIDIVNLNVGWQWNNVLLGIFGSNLTNERGFLNPVSIEGLAARPRPRTYGVSFSESF